MLDFESKPEVISFNLLSNHNTLHLSSFVPKSISFSNNEDVIQAWVHENSPASMPYLIPDSSIIYPYRVPNPSMIAPGVGGGIQRIDWNGTIIWDYLFSDSLYQHHHDISISSTRLLPV